MPFQFPKSNDNTWPLLQKYVANQYEFFTSIFPAMTFQSPSSSDTETNLIRKMLRNQATFFEAGGGGGGGSTEINPAVKVNRSSSQAIPNNTTTEVIFDTLEFESHAGMWSVGDPNRIYALEAGIYLVFAFLKFTNNATGIRQLQIRKNGVNPRIPEVRVAPNAADQLAVSLADIVDMQPGDYVSCFLYQNSGADLNLVADAASVPHFGMTKTSSLSVP